MNSWRDAVSDPRSSRVQCELASCVSQFTRRSSKTPKNSFKEKVKELQAEVEEEESEETPESGFGSPAEKEQSSPR